MKNSVIYENMELNGRNFLLVGIRGVGGGMGMCRVSDERSLVRKDCFYLGQEALINFLTQSPENSHCSKTIWQNSNRSKCSEATLNRLSTVCVNYFNYGYDLARAIEPVFDLLANGLYCVHVSKTFPTDGAGNFYWNGYLIRHEYNGSSDENSALEGKNFVPCFLIPTEQIASFSRQKLTTETDKIKKKKRIGGLAYHTCGMFSALLYGHHSALAALLNDTDFNCIIIEPITKVIYGQESDLYESQENSDESEKENNFDSTVPVGQFKARITAIGCPYATIPLNAISKNMLEIFLMTRKNALIKNFNEIKASSETPIKIRNKKLIPADTYAKSELCPDVEMIESAYTINSLSSAQAEALLAGQVEINGEFIVSGNYYNSIVTACNFLQYTDYDRFIDFAARVLMNPELSAVHGYLANRVSGIMNYRFFDAFKYILSSSDESYRQIMAVAAKYIDSYNNHMEQVRKDEIERQNIMQTRKAEILLEQERNTTSALEMANQIRQMTQMENAAKKSGSSKTKK